MKKLSYAARPVFLLFHVLICSVRKYIGNNKVVSGIFSFDWLRSKFNVEPAHQSSALFLIIAMLLGCLLPMQAQAVATVTVSTVAGTGVLGFADGAGSAAQFSSPVGVSVDGAGNVYVADTYNNRIRKIAVDGTVSTLAGTGVWGFADGAGSAAQFSSPVGVSAGRLHQKVQQ